MTYLIAPSLLSANTMQLGDEIRKVISAGADMIHFDVMDNHYVPNLSFGPPICKKLHQEFPQVRIDVHLMTKPVDELISQFAQLGVARISIHPDATKHLDRSLEFIQQSGAQVGLVLNPATAPDQLTWCHHRLDFVLVMTVNPGFAGQTLIPKVIDKIRWIKNQYPQLSICVDGGVTVENIAQLAAAGATQFVVGSALFSSADYQKTMNAMRSQLASITR